MWAIIHIPKPLLRGSPRQWPFFASPAGSPGTLFTPGQRFSVGAHHKSAIASAFSSSIKMSSSNRAVAVIADTSLGLSPDELATFRAHGARVLGTSVASSRASITSAATRGRGASRSSIASSSRAGSAASSHHGGGMSGRLMLDAGQLSQLGVYFERLMGSIQDRVDYVSSKVSTISTALT